MLGVMSRALGAAVGRREASAEAAAGAASAAFLVVGLGNAGAAFSRTRHNVGFRVVDSLAAHEGIQVKTAQAKALCGRGSVRGTPVVLAKPQTMMNLSGGAVAELLRKHRVARDRLVVVYDDLDLAVGAVKLRAKGSHGGHNGVRSVIERLGGSKDFMRVRVGIGRPSGRVPVAAHVLKPFGRGEQDAIEQAIDAAVEACRALLEHGTVERATNALARAAAT